MCPSWHNLSSLRYSFLPSMDNIRTVYADSRVPEDSPSDDLHIWTADSAGFEAWWIERGSPLWVGVDTTRVTLTDTERFNLLHMLKLTAEQGASTVIYTSTAPTDVEAPCGCHGYDSHCDYHTPMGCSDNDRRETAACFCCSSLDFVCSYHRT